MTTPKKTVPPALLILAAGMGSRYGGLKQLDPVGPSGETIVDYSIFDALRAGFGKIVFVIRKDIEEAFRSAIGARFENRVDVAYAFQELDRLPPGFKVPAGRTRPWGTTQAILSAEGAIREPFAVINADDFYGAGSYASLARHFEVADECAMVGFVLRNTLSEFGSVARGVCRVNAELSLESIDEMTSIAKEGDGAVNTDSAGTRTVLTGDEIVSMNMWGFTPQIFEPLRQCFDEFLREHGSDPRAECYLPVAINELVAAGQARVRVLSSADSWFGVTYREDRPRVVNSIASLIAQGRYPERLWP